MPKCHLILLLSTVASLTVVGCNEKKKATDGYPAEPSKRVDAPANNTPKEGDPLLPAKGVEVPTKNDPNTKISAATIEAWKKAGAEFGAYGISPYLGLTYHFDRSYLTSSVPAFRFPSFSKVVALKDLPIIEVPFGLSLEKTKLSDTTLMDLPRFKHLTALDLSQSTTFDVTEKGFAEIGKLSQLEELNLAQVQLSEQAVKVLKELKKLKSLDLTSTRLTDAGLKEISGMEQLSFLVLSNNKISATGLEELKRLKKLSYLNLNAANLTDADMKGLKDLDQIKTLILANNERLTDVGLREIVGGCSLPGALDYAAIFAVSWGTRSSVAVFG